MVVVHEDQLFLLVEETPLPFLVGIVVLDVVFVPHLIPLLGLILLVLPLELIGPPVKCATKWVTQPFNVIIGSTMPIMVKAQAPNLLPLLLVPHLLLIIIGTQTLEQPITSPQT